MADKVSELWVGWIKVESVHDPRHDTKTFSKPEVSFAGHILEAGTRVRARVFVRVCVCARKRTGLATECATL